MDDNTMLTAITFDHKTKEFVEKTLTLKEYLENPYYYIGVKTADNSENTHEGSLEYILHGKWLEKEVIDADETTIDAWQSAKCSVCGKYHTTPYMYHFKNYAYCPHCGSEMKGDDNDA